MQTLIITLLRNVIMTASKGAWATCGVTCLINFKFMAVSEMKRNTGIVIDVQTLDYQHLFII